MENAVKVSLNPYTGSRGECNDVLAIGVSCSKAGEFLAMDAEMERLGSEGFAFCAEHLADYVRFVSQNPR